MCEKKTCFAPYQLIYLFGSSTVLYGTCKEKWKKRAVCMPFLSLLLQKKNEGIVLYRT